MTPGKWHGYEAAFFVKHLGFTPLEVITLQTRENAVAVGLENKLGAIEPGMIADILILDIDPTQDVTTLGDPSHVCRIIKDGSKSKGYTLSAARSDRSAVRKDLHPYVGEFVGTQENSAKSRVRPASRLMRRPRATDV